MGLEVLSLYFSNNSTVVSFKKSDLKVLRKLRLEFYIIIMLI